MDVENVEKEQVKKYVVSVSHRRRSSVDQNWKDALKDMEGVSVTGATTHRAHFTSTPETAEKVRTGLGDGFFVEEVSERKPLDRE